MTKGPWRYEKSNSHHHVLMGEESLDVNSESDARAIALVPEFIKLVKYVNNLSSLNKAYNLAIKLRKKLDRK
jgi:hypothetical protein